MAVNGIGYSVRLALTQSANSHQHPDLRQMAAPVCFEQWEIESCCLNSLRWQCLTIIAPSLTNTAKAQEHQAMPFRSLMQPRNRFALDSSNHG